MLTLCSLCRRTMRGRIFESENMAHIDVDIGSRSCDPPEGRGRAREALARATMLKVHTANIKTADQTALTSTLLALRT